MGVRRVGAVDRHAARRSRRERRSPPSCPTCSTSWTPSAGSRSAATATASGIQSRTAPYRSWPEYLLAGEHETPRVPGWRAALAASDVGLEPFERGLATLRRLAPDLPDERRMIHDDLLARNVLVERRPDLGRPGLGQRLLRRSALRRRLAAVLLGLVPAMVLDRHRGGDRTPLEPGSGGVARVPDPYRPGLDRLLRHPRPLGRRRPQRRVAARARLIRDDGSGGSGGQRLGVEHGPDRALPTTDHRPLRHRGGRELDLTWPQRAGKARQDAAGARHRINSAARCLAAMGTVPSIRSTVHPGRQVER